MDEPIAISPDKVEYRRNNKHTLVEESSWLPNTQQSSFSSPKRERANPKGVYWRECPKKHLKKLQRVADDQRRAMLLTKRSSHRPTKLIPWLFCSSSSRTHIRSIIARVHQNQELHYSTTKSKEELPRSWASKAIEEWTLGKQAVFPLGPSSRRTPLMIRRGRREQSQKNVLANRYQEP